MNECFLEMFCKKTVLENFEKFAEKKFFVNKVACCWVATILKRDSLHVRKLRLVNYY